MEAFLNLQKPSAAREAAEKKRGLHWVLELLVFVAVFIAATVMEALILLPGELILCFSNADYREAAMAVDVERLMKVTLEITNSDAYMILMLFANLGMILAVCLFCRLLQKRPLKTMGFRKGGIIKEYFAGLGVGFVAFSAAVLLCVVSGSLKLDGLSPAFSLGFFLLFTVGFLIQGMAEEVLCRGYFMISVARRYPIALGMIANALFFAMLHLFNSGITPLAFFNLTLFGVFASVYFVRRGSIWGIGAFHSIWNLVQGNFYGINVSGMQTDCSILQSEMVSGKELWNGGAFGLEGGLAVTIILILGIVILLFMKNKETMSELQAAEAAV